ncbi:hypothetical protein RE428_10720 [Marinobacter nanhaiticus D15-8W]|nr:hypothetical protein RE428_10720 [Marinobacter nanhaiticus D15-8W]
MDIEAIRRYYDYWCAYDAMLIMTQTSYVPWHIVDTNDQERAYLYCIAHLVDSAPWTRPSSDSPSCPRGGPRATISRRTPP